MCLICEVLRLSALRIAQGALLPSPHPKRAEICGTLMMEEEGGEQQRVSTALHKGAPSQQGYPAQNPRGICKDAIPTGQKHKDISACLSLALL